MRLISCALFTAVALLCPLSMGVQPVLGQDTPIQPEETIVLFNGKDLSGFRTWLSDDHREDPSGVFTVVDQIDGARAIRVSGEKFGGFSTRDSYRDYHLIVEFRWGLTTWGIRQNLTRDSGVLLHCQGPDGNTRADFNGPWMRSVEAQIIQGGVGDIILIAGYNRAGEKLDPELTIPVSRDRDGEPYYDPEAAPETFRAFARINWYGRDPDWKDELDFRGIQDVESAVGEWTRMEVIARGDELTYLVNGRVVNRGFKSSLTAGRILFQSEGAEIYFRRIELHPLN